MYRLLQITVTVVGLLPLGKIESCILPTLHDFRSIHQLGSDYIIQSTRSSGVAWNVTHERSGSVSIKTK